jgi:hypothetical protein
MHSEHRKRYHLASLADVHPGDDVILDADAIAAVRDDRPGDVDWSAVEADARHILHRHRPSPDRLTFPVTHAGQRRELAGAPAVPVLLHRPNPIC